MADDARARLRGMLDPENFLGSGLTLQEWSLSNMVERWQNSLSNMTDREAERRRIRRVRRICVALDEVERTHGMFNMRGLEGGLIAVINGEWKEVQRIADDLLYRDEDGMFREKQAAAHAPVRALLLEACDEGLLLLPSGQEETRH